MKTIKIFTISILVTLSMNLSAQIMVNTNGRVGVASSSPARTLQVGNGDDIDYEAFLRLRSWWTDSDVDWKNHPRLEFTDKNFGFGAGKINGNDRLYSYIFDGASRSFSWFKTSNGNSHPENWTALMELNYNAHLTMGGQPSPRWDNSISAYVVESNHFYSHDNSYSDIKIGESTNEVLVRGDMAVGGTHTRGGYRLTVHGDAYAYGIWERSDTTMKNDIQEIDPSYCKKLKYLNGITYKLKPLETNNVVDTMLARDENKSVDKASNDSTLTTSNNTAVTSSSSSISDDTDEESVSQNSKADKTYSKQRIGLSAQQVKEQFPELVMEDDGGHMAINYDGFIPILIDAINQQQSKIQELENLLDNGENITMKSSSIDSEAMLYQNTPNPFTENTEIKYFLPENVNAATLYIYNLQGNQIKSFSLHNRGQANVTIHGSELQAGMYIYALIADGKEIDSKRMILTD